MANGVNLDEIAEKELLNEAKRGAARASVYGALGWQKCPLKPTNKIFLQNMLLSAISSNRQKVLGDNPPNINSKRKQDNLEAGGSVSKKPVSCDKPSNTDDRRDSPVSCSNKVLNRTNKKYEIDIISNKRKIQVQYRNSSDNRHVFKTTSSLTRARDNLTGPTDYDKA